MAAGNKKRVRNTVGILLHFTKAELAAVDAACTQAGFGSRTEFLRQAALKAAQLTREDRGEWEPQTASKPTLWETALSQRAKRKSRRS